ncbi:hypothetical protein HRbin20_01587 [bacterium HR20]|nr:hypothetical protein HRbin20_01587 [bacterium HR20]
MPSGWSEGEFQLEIAEIRKSNVAINRTSCAKNWTCNQVVVCPPRRKKPRPIPERQRAFGDDVCVGDIDVELPCDEAFVGQSIAIAHIEYGGEAVSILRWEAAGKERDAADGLWIEQ